MSHIVLTVDGAVTYDSGATSTLAAATAASTTPPVPGSLEALHAAGGEIPAGAPSTLSPMVASMIGASPRTSEILSERAAADPGAGFSPLENGQGG